MTEFDDFLVGSGMGAILEAAGGRFCPWGHRMAHISGRKYMCGNGIHPLIRSNFTHLVELYEDDEYEMVHWYIKNTNINRWYHQQSTGGKDTRRREQLAMRWLRQMNKMAMERTR